MSFNVGEASGFGLDGIAIRDDDENVLFYQTAGMGPPYGNDAPIGSRYLDFQYNVRYRKIAAGTGVDAWSFDVPKYQNSNYDSGDLKTSQILEAFDNAGGAVVPVFPTIDAYPFPSIRPGSELSTYSFPNIGEIQFNQDGNYFVKGHLSFVNSGGGNDKQCAAVPQLDTGSGFTTILGAFGWATVGSASDYQSAPFQCYLNGIVAGNVFRVGITKLAGGDANTAFGSSLMITPEQPKIDLVQSSLDAGDYDGNPNYEPNYILDAGEL